MPHKVHLDDVETIHRPGAGRVKKIVTRDTLGSEKLYVAVAWFEPGSYDWPPHAHLGIDEAVYVVQGSGQAWIEGEILDFRPGDTLFFPANARHCVRNTSAAEAEFMCMFSEPTSPQRRAEYPELKIPF